MTDYTTKDLETVQQYLLDSCGKVNCVGIKCSECPLFKLRCDISNKLVDIKLAEHMAKYSVFDIDNCIGILHGFCEFKECSSCSDLCLVNTLKSALKRANDVKAKEICSNVRSD